MARHNAGSPVKLAQMLSKRHLSARHQRRAIQKAIKSGKVRLDK